MTRVQLSCCLAGLGLALTLSFPGGGEELGPGLPLTITDGICRDTLTSKSNIFLQTKPVLSSCFPRRVWLQQKTDHLTTATSPRKLGLADDSCSFHHHQTQMLPIEDLGETARAESQSHNLLGLKEISKSNSLMPST